MTSYIKFFEDFLQKKEVDVQQRTQKDECKANSDDKIYDDENESSTTETVPSPKAELTPSPSPTPTITTTATKKMEHSYMRDKNARPMAELTNGLPPARTILVRRKQQCGSCHTHPPDEHELDETNQAAVPAYNEIGAKEAMNECARIAKYVKNLNSDEDDWAARVNQNGWTPTQKRLFEKITKILDDDQLGRLANVNRQNEAMHRRVLVDKSAARMRKLLASIAWDSRLTQWLHCFLMDSLPSNYMASYLDILQTLKTKVPILMDKMLFGRPLNISQELLAPVMKKKWEPQFTTKLHKLQQNAVIVALPSMPTSGAIPHRLQKWYQQLASIAQIVQITLPMINNHTNTQPLEQLAEQIVSLTRVKIQELRNESPTRSIILIGFNAGAALALQVAMSESIACVICMGFAYNTLKGVRGTPDDRILDLKVPILFVVGQNSQRTSQEEMEFLREKMQAEASLVIVGGADDFLRCSKSRRRIENVTQAMVDAMVVDEVFEFIKRVITTPPGPRVPTSASGVTQKSNPRAVNVLGEKGGLPLQRKRKQEGVDGDIPPKTKLAVGRPRTRPLPTGVTITQQQKSKQLGNVGGKSQQEQSNIATTANSELNLAMQTLLGDSGDEQHNDLLDSPTMQQPKKLMTNYELVSPPKAGGILKSTTAGVGVGGTKIKMIPSNQFLQIKPQQMQTQSKIYTIKTSPTVGAGVASATSSSSQSNSIGSIVRTTPNITSGQQQIFTLKSPNGKTTQFVTAGPATTQQKYTVVKNTLGGTMLQLTTAKNVAAAAAATATTDVNSAAGGVDDADAAAKTGDGRLDLSNIIDMPILFADSEGNYSETKTENQTKLLVNKPTTSSGVGQLIISQKIIKEANTPTTIGTTKGGAYVLSKAPINSGNVLSTQQLQTLTNKTTLGGHAMGSNKVVFINRNTMKPCPNIISRAPTAGTQNFGKYAKVMISNPQLKSSSPLITRPGIQIATSATPASGSASTAIQLKHISGGGTATTRGGGGSIFSLAGKPLQIVNKSSFISASSGNTNTATATATTVNANIVSEKPTIIRNIVVKPGNLKQIPAHLSGQLINRNLTVRKLVNIVPSSSGGGALAAATVNIATTEGAGGSSSAMQTAPKIIKLNPVNKSND